MRILSRRWRGGLGLLVAILILPVGFSAGADAAAELQAAPTVAGVQMNFTTGSNFWLLIDGREVGRETNPALMLPLGTHVFLVPAANVSSNALSAVTLDPDWGVGA